MAVNPSILRYFSQAVSRALSGTAAGINEIRLRTGQPLAVTLSDKTSFLTANGCLTEMPERALKITADDIRHCFEAVCRYSVHSCQNQINNGFVTVSGGHRAGLCGTAVYSSDGRIENIKYINGINFRIAGEAIGAADEIMQRIMRDGLKSIIVFGAPCSGKTTILRDLCRQVGDKYPVSLIDERFEIASVSGANVNNRVGANTDVFSGFTKPDGINTAVRVMSPRMIICDEIGSDEDISALKKARTSGVRIAASVHSGTVEELLTGKVFSLIEEGMFEYAVYIRDRKISGIFTAQELYRLSKEHIKGASMRRI